MSDQIVGTDAELMVVIEEELAKRHVASRSTGLIRLPRRAGKPVPPPEFWTQGEDTMAVELRHPTLEAAATLRAIMKARKAGLTSTQE